MNIFALNILIAEKFQFCQKKQNSENNILVPICCHTEIYRIRFQFRLDFQSTNSSGENPILFLYVEGRK